MDRLVIFNRCDGDFASRTRDLVVLLGPSEQRLTLAYRHDGTGFLGHPDGKPLVVSLAGKNARFLRLALPGTSYFHLDEVQAFTVDEPNKNVALRKSATQSSVSQWSKAEERTLRAWRAILSTTIRRGQALADSLSHRQCEFGAYPQVLQQVASDTASLDPAGDTCLTTDCCFFRRGKAHFCSVMHKTPL